MPLPRHYSSMLRPCTDFTPLLPTIINGVEQIKRIEERGFRPLQPRLTVQFSLVPQSSHVLVSVAITDCDFYWLASRIDGLIAIR